MAMMTELAAGSWSQYSDSAQRALRQLCSLIGVAKGFLVAIVVAAILIPKLRTLRMKLPPGPRITLPIVGNWWQITDTLNHRYMARMAQKFGDVFMLKMGQRIVIVISSPEGAKEVLSTQGAAFGSRASNFVFDIFNGNKQDMVWSDYGDHWRKVRRIMAVPFFTVKAAQRMHTVWEEELTQMIETLKGKPEAMTTGVVMRMSVQFMIYNIMYRMMFNAGFKSEDDPLYVKLRALNITRSQKSQSFEYNYGDFLPVLRPFLQGFMNTCQDLKKQRFAIYNIFLEDRKKLLAAMQGPELVTEKAGIDHILDAQRNGEITETNIFHMIENVNSAGTETLLWSLEWAMAELVSNPDIQTRIRDELDEILGKGKVICEADTHNNKLPYLMAFVKEVMRFHMCIPQLVPHSNLEPAKLLGYDIPAGSRIFVNSWWIANNPKYWDEPEKFLPERFLTSDSELTGNDFRFLPFGAGRRACPGTNIAVPLLPIVIGSLVQAFDLLLPPGVKKLDFSEQGGQFSNSIKHPSIIVAKPRSQDGRN